MSVFLLLTTIFGLLIIPFVIWGIKDYWCSSIPESMVIILGSLLVIFLIVALIQPISIKKELVRQQKERQQIEYQIENLNNDSDKIKLNEWILTYNDWVNDVNTSKEVYGYASWYYSVDMTNHTIINLV